MLYANFRIWCGENGLYPVSRPKLRDVIIGFWPGILSTKKRVFDAETGEIKPLWGLAGIRLRRDDDPDEDLPDSCSTVPECSQNEICHESSDTAECSGVPSNSKNYSAIQIDSPDLQIVKAGQVPANSWNTGTISDTGPEIRSTERGTLSSSIGTCCSESSRCSQIEGRENDPAPPQAEPCVQGLPVQCSEYHVHNRTTTKSICRWDFG